MFDIENFIPVTERLPEKDGWYLVAIDDLDDIVLSIKFVNGKFETESCDPKHITAWMDHWEPLGADHESDNV